MAAKRVQFDLTPFSLSDVTIISVCYRSDEVIAGMVASVPPGVPIVLVDNGGTNDFDTLPDERVVKIVKLSDNEGFGRGCNAGATVADTPYLLFLNPDARLREGALEGLIKAAERYPTASAFNPRIANESGAAYFKRRSYLLARREYMKRGWPEEDCEVPVLSGAALFVSKSNFDRVQGFDTRIFLYHEDDDISLRLRELGPLFYIRDALVEHAGGGSSERSTEVAYFKAFHMAQSRIYAGRKYRRPAPVLTTFLAGFLLLISPFSLVSRRKRAKACGLIKGAREVTFKTKDQGF